MTAAARFFDLRCSLLRAESDSEAFDLALGSFIGELEIPAGGGSGPLTLAECRTGSPDSPPHDAADTWRSDQPDFERYLFANGPGWTGIYGQGTLALRHDLAAQRTRVTLGPGAGWSDTSIAAIAAIEFAALAGGQMLLHSACLECPDRPARILLHAPSGTGKSTTAFALAGAGFRLCADDTSFLGSGAGQVRAWGLPRAFRVSRHTARMLPFLAPVLEEGGWREDEQDIPRDRMARLLPLGPHAPFPVAAVFRLTRTGAPRTTLRRTSPSEGLADCLAGNVRLGASGLSPHDRFRFDLLGQLFAGTPSFTLDLALDVEAIGDLVRSVL